MDLFAISAIEHFIIVRMDIKFMVQPFEIVYAHRNGHYPCRTVEVSENFLIFNNIL